MRLAQTGQAGGLLDEMIARPEQKDRVGGFIGTPQSACISNFRRGHRMLRLPCRGLPRLLHVLGDGIEQVHVIAERGQPAGINSRSTAGINDSGWRRRQMAKYQFARASLLELKPSTAEA